MMCSHCGNTPLPASKLAWIGHIIGDFIDDGRHHLAGTAPGRPELEQNGLVRIQHFLFEIGRGDIDVVGHDVNSCRHWALTELMASMLALAWDAGKYPGLSKR